MKKLLIGLSFVCSISAFSNCNVYIDGNGFNDTLDTVGGVEDNFETLPEKYKFSPKSMLVKALEKNNYTLVNEASEARYEVKDFGGRCYNQWVLSECDAASAKITIEDNISPDQSLNIQSDTSATFWMVGYVAANPDLMINTSGKAAFKNALEKLPAAKCD